MIAVLGMVVMLGLAWALSTNRRLVPWRTVLVGTGLQLLLALVILETPVGRALFLGANAAVTAFLGFADEGSRFIFGDGFEEHFIAFKVLPTIIFFSSVIGVLYHVGLVQRVVRLFAWAMTRLMGTSGAESLAASGNIFVGRPGRGRAASAVPRGTGSRPAAGIPSDGMALRHRFLIASA